MRKLGAMPMQDRHQRIAKSGQNVRAAAAMNRCAPARKLYHLAIKAPLLLRNLLKNERILELPHDMEIEVVAGESAQ